MTLPTNTDPDPSVAELPTCQNTLHACAPLMSVTVLDDPVIRLESVWKMNTELASPAPSSTNGPVRPSAPLLGPAYTPPCRVRLARSAVVVASRGRPAASTYAAVRSAWACWAAALVVSVVPGGSTMPGGKPVIDGPGQRPRLLSRMLPPVFVTVEPPRTA